MPRKSSRYRRAAAVGDRSADGRPAGPPAELNDHGAGNGTALEAVPGPTVTVAPAPATSDLPPIPEFDPRLWPPRVQLAVMVLVGFFLRLALSPIGGFGEDIAVMRY